jgi:hypothetical protein
MRLHGSSLYVYRRAKIGVDSKLLVPLHPVIALTPAEFGVMHKDLILTESATTSILSPTLPNHPKISDLNESHQHPSNPTSNLSSC